MDKLRVASCQFSVGPYIARNERYIRYYMKKASEVGAHLLHTSESCLSGYAGYEFKSFKGYDWEKLRSATSTLCEYAGKLHIWLVLGSTHFLDKETKPTNCLYLINPQGKIVDRYDKCMLPNCDQIYYSAGQHLVTHRINGINIGLAICYDVCYPQIFIAYRERGVTLILLSSYNARDLGEDCLDVLTIRELPTRCADNHMWAIANNSSRRYSHWGSFVTRPDATIAQQLKMNYAGMLVHDFPDGLSEGGWFHNELPMKLAEGQILHFGEPSNHPRQLNRLAQP